MLILITLMLLTEMLELDVVLGAFVAGMFIGRLVSIKPEAKHKYEAKLETLGFSFLIPVFFVTSGMGIDAHVVAEQWVKVLGFVLLILVVRGIPVWLLETKRPAQDTAPALAKPQQRQLALYAAVGLPIIVAVTEVATGAELISHDDASILVAGGALTVLLFPLLASMVGSRKQVTPAQNVQEK